MVHEGTGLWHAAGFSASRWLMIIIHGYRATTLVLYILLNVLVRTGEYNRFPDTPFGGAFVFPRVVCARASIRRQSRADSGVARVQLRALLVLTASFCLTHLTFTYSPENLFRKHALFFCFQYRVKASYKSVITRVALFQYYFRIVYWKQQIIWNKLERELKFLQLIYALLSVLAMETEICFHILYTCIICISRSLYIPHESCLSCTALGLLDIYRGWFVNNIFLCSEKDFTKLLYLHDAWSLSETRVSFSFLLSICKYIF